MKNVRVPFIRAVHILYAISNRYPIIHFVQMAHTLRHKRHHKRSFKRTAKKARASRRLAAGRKTQKKGWFSWLFRGGALGDTAANISDSSNLLSDDMRGAPAGVDANIDTPFHLTTGGRRTRRSARSARQPRAGRKQRGGVAPLDQAYGMLLDVAGYKQAGLNPEWPASGGRRRARKQ